MKICGGYKKAKFYFNQFWGYKNLNILPEETLRKLLYKKWLEIWKLYPYKYEDRLFDISKHYQKYLLKGKK